MRGVLLNLIFLQPLYQFIVNNFADKINHFPLIKLIFFGLDKTILYFLIFSVVRLIWLLAVKKRRNFKSEIVVWVFAFYIMLLMNLTVFRDTILPWEMQIYLNRPLSEINWNFLGETLKLTKGASLLDFFYNFMGNILWFVPFGLMLPTILRRKKCFWQTALIGLVLSLSIESLQFIYYTGVSDIDDIFFNLIGTIVGYGLFALTRRKHQK